MRIEYGTIKPKEPYHVHHLFFHFLILLLVRVFLLSSFIATLLIKPQINVLIVLALLVRMSQLLALAGKIAVIISALVQINKNISASVSPLQRNTGILEILLRDRGFWKEEEWSNGYDAYWKWMTWFGE